MSKRKSRSKKATKGEKHPQHTESVSEYTAWDASAPASVADDGSVTSEEDARIISGFSKLPGEIRNNIYDIILADEAPSPTATKVHYDPDNSWEDLHCRNPSHLYVGFIQVNRTVRAEFGPLYNFVREFSFPELGYILRQADPEDGQWYDEIIPIFSALGEKLPKAPGLDITPLLCIDWTSDALAWPWTSIFHYNKRDYSLHIRAICRLLRTGNLWCRVYDDFGIVGISIGQRNGWSLVLTLELGEELYGLHDMKKQSEVVADFIR